jgi:hypothetical protein
VAKKRRMGHRIDEPNHPLGTQSKGPRGFRILTELQASIILTQRHGGAEIRGLAATKVGEKNRLRQRNLNPEKLAGGIERFGHGEVEVAIVAR